MLVYSKRLTFRKEYCSPFYFQALDLSLSFPFLFFCDLKPTCFIQIQLVPEGSLVLNNSKPFLPVLRPLICACLTGPVCGIGSNCENPTFEFLTINFLPSNMILFSSKTTGLQFPVLLESMRTMTSPQHYLLTYQ